MLTGDLVRVRATREGLKVGFIDPDQARMVEKAAGILAAFQDNLGQSRAVLDDALAEVEGDGIDHKLTRGLAKICLDRAEFDTTSPMPPVDLRKAVFALAARVGPVRSVSFELAEVDAAVMTEAALWERLSGELGIPAASLVRGLYADLPSEQTLMTLDVPELPGLTGAEWLLHRYNTALVQATLLRARSLTLTLVDPAPGEARALFRALKFHQLLAEVAVEPGGYRITIDGPASLFSQTTRYGSSLAKFFPAILLLSTAWTLRASVLWGAKATTLELSHTQTWRSHYRAQGAWKSREAQWFYERWGETVPDWTIEEGGLPLDQGGESTVIPDFTLRRGGAPVYVEILGFWRKGSLTRRLETMRRHGPRNLIIAASRKLFQDADPEALPEGVLLFAEVIPVKEVLRMAIALLDAPTPRARNARKDTAPKG